MLKKTIVATLLSCGLISLLVVSGFAQQSELQTTTFIDVGQGDAALLRDGAGFDVLIDGGLAGAGPTVLDYLHTHNVTELDVILASHPDSDHIGGLIAVLQADNIQVEQVLYNGYPGSTETWTSFTDAITAEGLTLYAAQYPGVLSWGLMQVHILNPVGGLASPDPNDASLVLRIDYGQTTYLFTGDINATIEATVIARTTPITADILKIAHHGSASSSSPGFLSAASPNDAIISVGDNGYGHPATDTLERIHTSGATIWRTDQNGTIVVSSDGVTYSIQGRQLLPRLFIPVIFRDSTAVMH